MIPSAFLYVLYASVLAILIWGVVRLHRLNGLIAPATYTFAYCIATMIGYFLNSWIELPESQWYAGYEFKDGCAPVLVLGLYFAIPAAIAAWYGGTSGRLAALPAFTKLTVTDNVNLAALAGGIFCCLLYLWHFMAADFGNIYSYREYMSSREPEFYNLTDLVSVGAHVIRKPVGLLLSAALPLFWCNRRMLAASLILFPLVYIFFLNVVEHSKYCAVYLIVSGITASVVQRRQGSTKWLVVSGVSAIIVFSVLLMARHERIYGINSMVSVFSDFESKEANAKQTLSQAIHLLAGGGRILDQAQSRRLEVSARYRMLSFSPLVSQIDGFDKTWEPGPEIAITYTNSRLGEIWVPFSGVSQLQQFGIGYLVCFWIFFLVCISFLQRTWVQNPTPMMTICNAPFYLFVPMFHFYPVRNSFRLLLLTVILSAIYRSFHKKRQFVIQLEETGGDEPDDDSSVQDWGSRSGAFLDNNDVSNSNNRRFSIVNEASA